ncbi:uncharacterized protein LOC121372039 [Gigantopelta aegis]|uniref:uncharacterized protein LOC121372039 n=1 Tax=Gigantopelta aegis TaxID=1735272 RepID=UPI001B88D094|nr:uncharacterized protein LOC121372039 [Gigantopelta aegis]
MSPRLSLRRVRGLTPVYNKSDCCRGVDIDTTAPRNQSLTIPQRTHPNMQVKLVLFLVVLITIQHACTSSFIGRRIVSKNMVERDADVELEDVEEDLQQLAQFMESQNRYDDTVN